MNKGGTDYVQSNSSIKSKGGVGKTVSCVNLGIGLAQEGRKDDLRKEYSTADVTNRHYQGGFPKTVRRECVGGRGIR